MYAYIYAVRSAKYTFFAESAYFAHFYYDVIGGDGDNWSLGSAGSFTEADSSEVRSLKEKLIKLKQNEELLKTQLEVLQSTIQIMGKQRIIPKDNTMLVTS